MKPSLGAAGTDLARLEARDRGLESTRTSTNECRLGKMQAEWEKKGGKKGRRGKSEERKKPNRIFVIPFLIPTKETPSSEGIKENK